MYHLGAALGLLNNSNSATVLLDLTPDDADYISVEDQIQSTIREHKDNAGGHFNRFNILKVSMKTFPGNIR